MNIPFRYRRLGYVALNVTDLPRSLAFYRDLVGLMVVESTDQFAALRCSRDHHNVLLYRAAEAGLKRVAFELDTADDLARARMYLKELGVQFAEVNADERRALQLGQALRLWVPGCGLCCELFVQPTYMALPYQPTVTKIERLGHVVVNVQRFDEVMAFLIGKLGFRVSDYVPGFAAFLRCFPNPLHHTLAIIEGTDDHLNHVNFMVRDIDDVGQAMNRMKRAKVEIVFGPGRHQPSESIFLYFLDPDGMTLEYSFGMEQFPEIAAREPRLLERRPETLDSWGSIPTPDFGKIGSIEANSAASGALR